MVIGLVETPEGGVVQAGDHGGIASRVEAVGRVGEEGSPAKIVVQVIGVGMGSLHLVEDDALVFQGAGHGVDLVVPALLPEGVLGDEGMQYGVEVYIDEVPEILEVGRGEGIDRLVGIGEGVEEGAQGALHQFDEGFLDWVFFRAAEDRVLEDVGHTVRPPGRSAETDAEGLVLVGIDDRKQTGACAIVDIEPRGRGDFG